MEFAISQPKMVRLPRNKKQTHRLNSRPQMWPSGLTLTMTLTLNFQGQIWNFPYLGQKWSDCHKTKSKHIDWTPGHDLDIWIFKVKCDLYLLMTKVRCKDLPDSDLGDFRCRRAIDSSSLWGYRLITHTRSTHGSHILSWGYIEMGYAYMSHKTLLKSGLQRVEIPKNINS